MFWTIVIVVFAVVLADAKLQSMNNKLSGPGAGWS
jgi:hypothetical protein